MFSPLKRLGQIYRQERIQAYNRTGATLTKGMVAMCDLLGTQSETSTAPGASGYGEGDASGVLANLTPVATAGLQTFPMVVCLDASVADNAIGNFCIFGPCEVAVGDDDVTSNDIDRGDPVTVLNGVTYIAEAVTTNRCCGVALEDAAADSTVTARTVDTNSHLRWVLWNGVGCGVGFAL